MQKISAIIITFNEEQNIRRCLQSLEGVADEIIVVDSYSTDATQEICTQHGIRFIQRLWQGYSNQKNYAQSLASYHLILSLDADEVLSDELKASIMAIKQKSSNGIVAYSMKRLTNYCGKWIRHGSWNPDKKLRLYDCRYASWNNEPVHEEIVCLKPTTIITLKGTILHYSFKTPEEFYRQSEHFATLATQAMFEKGKTISRGMLLLKTGWVFWRSYIIKAGFLDGKAGFTISRMIAASTYQKYCQLRAMRRSANHK
jgi:glycosyltransferase involved in cell wall biosynthesis